MITVCVPVWNGAAFVAETLRSVLAQQGVALRVEVSVDRCEDDSARACREFASDPRVRVHVQPERLGWVANCNWLLERVQTELFCVVPHDDLLEPGYLAKLAQALAANPAAVLAYSDVLCFGERNVRLHQPSIRGERWERVTQFLDDHFAAVGFRGVGRRSALAGGALLRPNAAGDYAADTVWLLRLAAAGEFMRIPELLYRKRLHLDSQIARWGRMPGNDAELAWCEHCVECFEAALDHPWSDEERHGIAAAALARLLQLNRASWGLRPLATDPPARLRIASRFMLRIAHRLEAAAPSAAQAPRALPQALPGELYWRLGADLLATREKGAAARLLRRATLSPEAPPEAFGLLAEVLAHGKRGDEAVQAARRHVELRPDDVEAWLRLGLVLNLLRRHAEAEESQRRALELSPEHPAALYHLAVALHGLGRAGEALQAARRAAGLRPDVARFAGLARELEKLAPGAGA